MRDLLHLGEHAPLRRPLGAGLLALLLLAACGGSSSGTPASSDAATTPTIPNDSGGSSDQGSSGGELGDPCAYVTVDDVTRIVGAGFSATAEGDNSCQFSRDSTEDLSDHLMINVVVRLADEVGDLEQAVRVLASATAAQTGAADGEIHLEKITGIGDEAWLHNDPPFESLDLKIGKVVLFLTMGNPAEPSSYAEQLKALGSAAAERG